MKIAILFDALGPMAVTQTHVQMVQDALPEAEVLFASKQEELIEQEFRADVLICWATGGRFTAGKYCEFAAGLKWIHCLSAGVEGLMEDEISQKPGLRVTCSKGIHGIPMANHVMGFILSFLRRFPELGSNQRNHLWQRPMPEEAVGKQLCVIGMGSIGKDIAKAAKAFDMRVVGIRRSLMPVEYVDGIYPTGQLEEVLAQSDFVVMLLPANPATRGFMTAARFAAMKPGAVFINVGRGQTIDEAALIASLQAGHLSGAALDVFDPEPPACDNPLWDMPNVIMTPHVAADTPMYMNRAFGVFVKNVPLYMKNVPMISEVDMVNQY